MIGMKSKLMCAVFAATLTVGASAVFAQSGTMGSAHAQSRTETGHATSSGASATHHRATHHRMMRHRMRHHHMRHHRMHHAMHHAMNHDAPMHSPAVTPTHH